MKNKIIQITEEAKKLFCLETERMFLERVKEEDRLARQYKGREFYELIQNIDDAFDPNGDKACIAKIELKDNWLTVSNNGKPFTYDTLKRLCQGKVSGKSGDYIGCKGIGFRSVLNWSDHIEIYSGKGDGDISVRFSKEYADSILAEISDNNHIKDQIRELKELQLEPVFPIFKAPEYLEPFEKDFDTVIRIKINSTDTIEKIKNEIHDFDSSILLFLPHIQEIEFLSDGGTHSIITKTNSNGQVTINRGE